MSQITAAEVYQITERLDGGIHVVTNDSQHWKTGDGSVDSGALTVFMRFDSGVENHGGSPGCPLAESRAFPVWVNLVHNALS